MPLQPNRTSAPQSFFLRSELLASEVVWAPVTHESYWQAGAVKLSVGHVTDSIVPAENGRITGKY